MSSRESKKSCSSSKRRPKNSVNQKQSNRKDSPPKPIPSMAIQLGKAVKILRGRLRLSQTEVAARESHLLTQGYISRVEKGQIYPRDERLAAIIRALNTSSRELWRMAESLDGIDLDDKSKDSLLECIGHNEFGHSFEEVKAMYRSLSDDVVIELDQINNLVSSGRKLQLSQVTVIDKRLRKRAELLPEDPDTLREFISGILDLFKATCEGHAVR